jgi:hypothetical protein
MNKIHENIEELFDIYKDKFGIPFCKEDNLRKEFENIIKLKIEFMPHWFVLELINMDYDISNSDEDFNIY